MRKATRDRVRLRPACDRTRATRLRVAQRDRGVALGVARRRGGTGRRAGRSAEGERQRAEEAREGSGRLSRRASGTTRRRRMRTAFARSCFAMPRRWTMCKPWRRPRSRCRKSSSIGALATPPSVLVRRRKTPASTPASCSSQPLRPSGGRGGGSPRLAQGSVPDAAALERGDRSCLAVDRG